MYIWMSKQTNKQMNKSKTISLTDEVLLNEGVCKIEYGGEKCTISTQSGNIYMVSYPRFVKISYGF